jgi:UDP-2,3-diacylglucosamine hydrolase
MGVAHVELPPSITAVDFVSDLHLCPELPRTLAAFEGYLRRTRVGAVFILGDLFEAWVGDDASALPFERECVDMLAAAARRHPVYVMRGNRDFLLGDRFFAETGAIDLPDPVALHARGISPHPVLLSHGDALCVADVPYQQFRAQVRQPAWQAAFLARPLHERQAIGAQMRAASRSHQQQQQAPVTWADADPALAGEWLAGAGAGTLIHGHTHRPQTEHRPEGWTRHVLSDWECEQMPERAEVLRWTATGMTRIAPSQA